MITFINEKDNLSLTKAGHQHENKALLDSIKKDNDSYKIDNKDIRLKEDGAVFSNLMVAINDSNEQVLRIPLKEPIQTDLDSNIKIECIEIPFVDCDTRYIDDFEAGEYSYYGVRVNTVNNTYIPMRVVHYTGKTQYTLLPNAHFDFGEVDILHIYLEQTDEGVLSVYSFSFIANDSTIFTLPEEVVWGNDNEIVIEAGKRYEVNIFNNVALWTAATVEAVS